MSAAAGLCAACAFARAIVTRRGAAFVRCVRAQTEPEFEKFPRLPVTVCRGYEPRLIESRDPSEESPW